MGKDVGSNIESKILKIEKSYLLNSFLSFYKFCFSWSVIVGVYFLFQTIAQGFDLRWSSILTISIIGSFIYFLIIKNVNYIFSKRNNIFYFWGIVVSSWFLSALQFVFIETSFYGFFAALHTVSGIPYVLFFGLFYFLPEWKMTVLSSLGPIVALSLHYSESLGTFWIMGDKNGVFDLFYIIQLIIEMVFFIVFLGIVSKKKEDKMKSIKELLYKKIISSAHFKVMNANKKIRIGNWEIKTKAAITEFIDGADLIVVDESDSGDIYVCLGDVVGHGLEVSSGSLIASTVLKTLIKSGAHPIEMFSSVNSILSNLGEEEGGELFLQVLKLRKDGSIKIYGHPGGDTKFNKEPVKGLFFSILGKDANRFLNKTDKYFSPVEIKLKSGDLLETMTDGWSERDAGDDKTYVRIRYV